MVLSLPCYFFVSALITPLLRARLNDFSGTIPLEVWELQQLMTFDVTNNRWACGSTRNSMSSNCGSSQQQQLNIDSVGAAAADDLQRHIQQVRAYAA